MAKSQVSKVISFRTIMISFLFRLSYLSLQFSNILRILSFFLFSTLTKTMRDDSISSSFLVSIFRRSVNINKYLNETSLYFQHHHLILTLRCRAWCEYLEDLCTWQYLHYCWWEIRWRIREKVLMLISKYCERCDSWLSLTELTVRRVLTTETVSLRSRLRRLKVDSAWMFTILRLWVRSLLIHLTIWRWSRRGQTINVRSWRN